MKRRSLDFLAVGVAWLLSAQPLDAAEHEFRTDINPSLLYFQAFLAIPQLNEADTKYLFDFPGGWPSEPFDERHLELLKKFDSSFKLIQRARFSQVPCDWGYDLSDGPEALLPGLAPAKRISQAARLRAMAGLENGEFDKVREELAATFTLARNLSKDRILISCLVQIAMENILSSIVMENYYRFSADQLEQLLAAFDSAPKRGTIAETIGSTERDAFFGYISRKVTAMIEATKGNEDLFWSRFEAFWNPIATDFESTVGPDPSAERIRFAAETPAGVLRLLNEMPALYTETARVMALPYSQFKEQATALFSSIENSPNPFLKQFFTIFRNIRTKEFSAMVRQEMLRAAAAYKRGGMAALQKIQDPLIGGSFEFTRVQFEGTDRGFKLKSTEAFRDFDEVMIFVEKPGKPFRLDGKNAGNAR